MKIYIGYDSKVPIASKVCEFSLRHHSKEDLVITKGDRVAQLVMERISMMPAVEVDDLDATERGAGGFGSTGVSSNPKKQKTGEQ